MTRILIMIFLAMCSCAGDQKQAPPAIAPENPSTAKDTEFLKFISLLPELKIPLEVNCERCCKHAEIDYESKLVAKFRPEGSTIVGVIAKMPDKVILLVTYAADMIIPSVKVYDLEGKMLGEKNFMTGYCGGDFEYYATQYIRINSDYSITAIDTSYHLKMDTIHYQVIDTTKIEITTAAFQINKRGELVESKSPTTVEISSADTL